jgi:hypothetical protein
LPATTATLLGAPGAPVGVTAADAADATLVPTAFAATTVNVYAVPSVRPETTAVKAPVVVAVFPPGDDVTVYPVTGLPPSDVGAVQDTVT